MGLSQSTPQDTDNSPEDYFFDQDNDKPLKWYQKILYAVPSFLFFMAAVIVGKYIKNKIEQRQHLKTKLKYFNPTIKQGWFGKTITWTMRDKPLSDEQLEEFDK